MKDSVANRAIVIVIDYYKRKGWNVRDVSHTRGEHFGYDLLATNESEQLMIEVKGSTRPYGIPDPYGTEFDRETRRLIADVLCVVYFLPDQPNPMLAVIRREDIPPDMVEEKLAYRIKGRFKNERTISKFLVDL